MKKNFFTLILTALLLTSLFSNCFANEASNSKVDKKGKAIQVIEKSEKEKEELQEKFKDVQVINKDVIDELSEISDINITENQDGTAQYVFKEKTPSRVTKYENGAIEEESFMVAMLALPNQEQEEFGSLGIGNETFRVAARVAALPVTATTWSDSKTLTNSDVIMTATMYYSELSDSSHTISKMTEVEGTVVKNFERYGKNLEFKYKCEGERMDSSFNSYALGHEGWYYNKKPDATIGTTYNANPGFDYYYLTSHQGLLAFDFSYQVSHNGSKYYTYKISMRHGQLDL